MGKKFWADKKNWHWTDWLMVVPAAAAIFLFIYFCVFVLLSIFSHPNSFVESVIAGFGTAIVVFAIWSKPPEDYEAKSRKKN
jgi:hypothetical protein